MRIALTRYTNPFIRGEHTSYLLHNSPYKNVLSPLQLRERTMMYHFRHSLEALPFVACTLSFPLSLFSPATSLGGPEATGRAGTLPIAFQGCSHCGSETHLDMVAYWFCGCSNSLCAEGVEHGWFQERAMGIKMADGDSLDWFAEGAVLDGGFVGFVCT